MGLFFIHPFTSYNFLFLYPPNLETLKPTSLILTIILLLGQTKNSTAQLWRYLNYDPKVEKVADEALDKEACSITSKSETIDGVKNTYKVRTYCVQSFDGIRSKIALSETSHGHILSIEGDVDSIEIEDISALVKVHFLRPELLEVVYSPRGGSDQGFDYVIILGINKKQLWIVSEFLTINEYTVPDEYHLHEVRLKLQGQTMHDCKLIASVRDLLKSDTSRSKNYDRKSVHIFRFDENRKIFYNKIESLNAVFRPNTSADKDRSIIGDYPMIDLGSNEQTLALQLVQET
jgi:hypothetical protein